MPGVGAHNNTSTFHCPAILAKRFASGLAARLDRPLASVVGAILCGIHPVCSSAHAELAQISTKKQQASVVAAIQATFKLMQNVSAGVFVCQRRNLTTWRQQPDFLACGQPPDTWSQELPKKCEGAFSAIFV